MASCDLLLVGRDGNGKSSTGNSILNQKVFNPRTTYSQGSSDLLLRSATVEERAVNVLDGISIRDATTDGKENVLATIRLAEKAVSMFASGFSALVLVLKYGVRFTQQEKTVVSTIRCLFGENVFRNYGIIVLTFGDSFEKDMEEEPITFEAWCRQQTGDVRDLFRECGDRYVLFNNRANENGTMRKQVKDLLSKVAEIQSRGSRYTLNNFESARPGQRKMLVESKLPELQRETSQFLEDITRNLRKLEDSYCKPANCLQELAILKQRVDQFKAHLEEEDEGTNSIVQLKLQISVTEASISTKKERNERKIEYESMIPRAGTPPVAGTAEVLFNQKTAIICVMIVLFILFVLFIFPL